MEKTLEEIARESFSDEELATADEGIYILPPVEE